MGVDQNCTVGQIRLPLRIVVVVVAVAVVVDDAGDDDEVFGPVWDGDVGAVGSKLFLLLLGVSVVHHTVCRLIVEIAPGILEGSVQIIKK